MASAPIGAAIAHRLHAAGVVNGHGKRLGEINEQNQGARREFPHRSLLKAARDRSTVGSVAEDQLHVEHVVHQHRPGGELILVGNTEDQVLTELVVEADGVGEVVQASSLKVV